MRVSSILDDFAVVSQQLRDHFPDVSTLANESSSQYSSSHQLTTVSWIDEHLPVLSPILLSAGFTLKLKSLISGYKIEMDIQNSPAGGLILTEPNENESALSTASMSEEAIEAFNNFRAFVKTSTPQLKSFLNHANELANRRVNLVFTLDLYLNKAILNNRLAGAGAVEHSPHIISFLFREALMRQLEKTTVDTFESEFLRERKRTVLLVFDLKGVLTGEFLIVCGCHHNDLIESLIASPLSIQSFLSVEESHKFRRNQSFGNFASKWFLPEILALTATHGDKDQCAELRRQFQRLQPALSALFIADLIEVDQDGIYSVEYRGFRPRRFKLEDAQFLAHEKNWDDLYALYQYAYDGHSADKLEIVQQFLSQFAEDVVTLCTKATEIREASKKTYDRALITKVEEYFEARQSIQERIQTAVAELTNDVISLSRDISADLYKILGIIALAVAGWFFKGDTGLVAILLGFLAIAIYLSVVLLYHFPTLQSAAKLRTKQHEAYINSFDDVLTAAELRSFLNNPNWNDARTLFSGKHWWATSIYLIFSVLSLIVVVGIVISMWLSTPEIPPVRLAIAVKSSLML